MKTDLGFIQKLTRLYTFYTPIRKGKYRLALASLGLEKDPPKQVVAKTSDGRTLKVNFNNNFAHFVYFLGEYEPAITNVIEKIVKPGDICFDIGGNIGWYTTLLQTMVGKGGEVHSFEPVPPTFEILEENVNSNKNSEVVRLNKLALGENKGEANLHIFDDFDAHATMSSSGEKDFTVYACRVSTINSYLKEHNIKNVKFAKVDIEGAELMMLRGATDFFKQEIPPVFEIEMALDTTKGFGYLPNDIIEFIRAQSDYEFYAIDEFTFNLTKIEKIEAEDKGANVLCVPKGLYREELKSLTII